MSAVKYLLDEHVNPRLQKALRRQSPEMVVWCIGDPGIFILNPGMTLGETVDELTFIWSASEAEEYAGQLSYLPISA